MTRRTWVHPIADIFYIIGVVVVIIVVAGFLGPTSIGESCKPCSLAVPSGRDTGARHRAFGFWGIVGYFDCGEAW
jgi:hypothetical protein